MSLCKTVTDKVASLALIDSEVDTSFEYEAYLESGIGTKYQHYWFQKLEYILWKNWALPKPNEFENYRILSRNSIEHIYPKNPENKDKSPDISPEFLHSFGNLVLLSVSQNSEYSRKSYDEKKGLFNYKNTFDTLKSYYIFKNKIWTITEIKKHERDMIEAIKNHYNI